MLLHGALVRSANQASRVPISNAATALPIENSSEFQMSPPKSSIDARIFK